MKPKKAVRAKARKSKVEPWRVELARIVKFLNKNQANTSGDSGASKLWDVLSALRGPDSDGDEIKFAVTGVLRRAAGLVPLKNAAVNVLDEKAYAMRRNRMFMFGYSHFHDHARKAFSALDLQWDGVNEARE